MYRITVNLDFERVIYLGAGGFYGLAHEAQLKILELTAGKITTMYESPIKFVMVQSHLLMIRHWLFFSHQMMLILASMMLTLLNEDGIAKSVVALSADQLGGN